jgi:hypothetical protein
MKKLIAFLAVTTLASTSAIAGIALTGGATVTFDDNGAGANTTTYDADISAVGTNGGTTVTIGMDVDAGATITGVDLASTIGPLTIAADMHNTTETTVDCGVTAVGVRGDGLGGRCAAGEGSDPNPDDRSVTVTLDVPIGDATIGLSDAGNVTVSGTFSGVTITHTIQDGADKTVAAASIAGMDIDLTNSAGATTWSIATTVSGVDLTLDSENDITAAFGLTGNTMTVTHVGARAKAAHTAVLSTTNAVNAYTTVAIARDLTSGATLTATYSSLDDSLTLAAAVTF